MDILMLMGFSLIGLALFSLLIIKKMLKKEGNGKKDILLTPVIFQKKTQGTLRKTISTLKTSFPGLLIFTRGRRKK